MKTYRLVAPSDPSRCVPFRIESGPSEDGPRIGGRAPRGIGDSTLVPGAIYVLTVPVALGPELHLSVFIQRDIGAAMNSGLFADDRIVAVPHEPCPRRRDGRFRSSLSEHPIVLLGEVSDAEEGATCPRGVHKVGGRPYCIQEPELEGAEALLRRGSRQLVQLDFPGAEDGDVRGDWPFMDGMFNLFGEPPFETFFWTFQK